MKRFILNVALVSTVAVANQAFATPVGGAYAGAGFGQSTYDSGCETGSSTVLSDCTDSDTSIKVFAGTHVTQTLSVEAAWVNVGKETSKDRDISGGAAYNTNSSIKTSSLQIDFIQALPINDAFSFFGKLGISRNKVDWKIDGIVTQYDNPSVVYDNIALSGSDNSTGLVFGVGASYRINVCEVRAGYDVLKDVKLDDAKENISNIGIDAIYHF